MEVDVGNPHWSAMLTISLGPDKKNYRIHLWLSGAGCYSSVYYSGKVYIMVHLQ